MSILILLTLDRFGNRVRVSVAGPIPDSHLSSVLKRIEFKGDVAVGRQWTQASREGHTRKGRRWISPKERMGLESRSDSEKESKRAMRRHEGLNSMSNIRDFETPKETRSPIMWQAIGFRGKTEGVAANAPSRYLVPNVSWVPQQQTMGQLDRQHAIEAVLSSRASPGTLKNGIRKAKDGTASMVDMLKKPHGSQASGMIWAPQDDRGEIPIGNGMWPSCFRGDARLNPDAAEEALRSLDSSELGWMVLRTRLKENKKKENKSRQSLSHTPNYLQKMNAGMWGGGEMSPRSESITESMPGYESCQSHHSSRPSTAHSLDNLLSTMDLEPLHTSSTWSNKDSLSSQYHGFRMPMDAAWVEDPDTGVEGSISFHIPVPSGPRSSNYSAW